MDGFKESPREILPKTNTSAATGRVNCPTRKKLIWEPTNPGVLGAELVVSGEEIEGVYFPTQNPSLTSKHNPPEL